MTWSHIIDENEKLKSRIAKLESALRRIKFGKVLPMMGWKAAHHFKDVAKQALRKK